MPPATHPLQNALNRATAATYTVVDLIDIARQRKPGKEGREARPDARQASLYKAVVASSVGAIEESFEALTLAGLTALGTPARAQNMLARAISKGMQSPSPENLKGLMRDYLDFNAGDHWSAHLSHSPATHRPVKQKDQTRDHRIIYTNYSQFSEFKGDDLSAILSMFVKIRNSFAHQDTSSAIFTRPDQTHLRAMRNRKAHSPEEKKFIESTSASCAVTLDAKASATEDPLVKWTVHETHAVNSLLMFIGLIISTSDALALHLETTAGVKLSDYDPLVLQVQDGRWWDWSHGHDFSSSNVGFKLTRYRPLLR